VKKSMPLSAKGTEPSPEPDPSFLFKAGRAWIMGVLNATPDSFYAGSRAFGMKAALSLAAEMVESAADCLDIGGESTRPGAQPVSASEELARTLPLIQAIRERWPSVLLSIDTQKAEVAREALARGAGLVNDISALRGDPAMAEVVAEAGAPVILMHMQGTPQTMQVQPRYKDVVAEVKSFFEERIAFAIREGIDEKRIILDPGIGFGKTLEHNLTLLRRLSEFVVFGRPLLVGVSRKSFIGRWLGGVDSPLPVEERLEGSLAAALWAVHQGARGLRVHDVAPTRRVLQIWEGIQQAS
jgi:dihydropteroate synthase